MSNSIAKEVTIKGENIDGDTVELEIPLRSKKVTASNNITSFQRPKTDPQPDDTRETRALNMNRIALEVQIEAKLDDDFAAKNHNGNGDRPNLENKEDWINEAWKLFVANTILDLKATNSDTHAETSEFSGYKHNLDWQEQSRTQSSVYDVTIKFVDEVPMNS